MIISNQVRLLKDNICMHMIYYKSSGSLIVFLLCPAAEQTFKISFCGILGLATTVGYCSKLYKEPTVSCLWKKQSFIFIFSHSLCTVTFLPILPLGCFLCLEVCFS